MKLKKIGDNLYQRQDGKVQDRDGKIIHDREEKTLIQTLVDAVTPNEAPETTE